MTFGVVRREVLRHNPLNEVTASVERRTDASGATSVVKRLRRAEGLADPQVPWAAAGDPAHWNYWRREVLAYRTPALRAGLEAAGLGLPVVLSLDEDDRGATLCLEDLRGTPGTAFSIDDHAALATGLGRWHAAGQPAWQPWMSRGFLRAYSTTRPAPWALVDDDAAWEQPLVRNHWPAGLRDGWQRLLAHRAHLLEVMERLPRALCHLDLWVSNEFRRPGGSCALIDWGYVGDGAVGEDVGNHVPDATLDLFWPAERIAELDEVCFTAYLHGLRSAGWSGDERDVRLGVTASAVKYAWLLPLMLGQASEPEQRAYHERADPDRLYQQRGLALQHLVRWCDEALALLS